MKKSLGIVILMMMFSVSTAAEISFSPNIWSIGKWCLVTTDIVIDTQGKEIAATDIIIESSLEFVDFVPSKLFPYFLPPKVRGNIIHLVGFTTDKSNRVTGNWSIGTLYMQQKDTNTIDWSLKLYFTKAWDTTDSNLSIAWWVDVLDTVGDGYYTFDATNICEHTAAGIDGWIANISLNDMMRKMTPGQRFKNIDIQKILLIFGGFVVVGIVLFMYYKKHKLWKNS